MKKRSIIVIFLTSLSLQLKPMEVGVSPILKSPEQQLQILFAKSIQLLRGRLNLMRSYYDNYFKILPQEREVLENRIRTLQNDFIMLLEKIELLATEYKKNGAIQESFMYLLEIMENQDEYLRWAKASRQNEAQIDQAMQKATPEEKIEFIAFKVKLKQETEERLNQLTFLMKDPLEFVEKYWIK